jgi:TonB family protein
VTLAWIVKATWLLAAALGAAALLRRRPAALRFATLAASLLALLTLPLVETIVPRRSSAAPPMAGLTVAATDVSPWLHPMAEEPLDRWQTIWMMGTAIFLLQAGAGYALSQWRTPSVPMTVGVVRPRIVLPAAAGTWSAGMRRSVLLHEQAHIDRRDPLWNLTAQLTRAIYWFHPLVWLVLRQLHSERERACDDAVLASGVRPSDYATHLLACARLAASTVPGLPMAHSNLAMRVEAVLAPALPRAPVSTAQRALLVVACSALLIPLAAFGSSSSVSIRSFPMYRKFVLPLFAAAAAAQSAELSGRIYDASNATVPNAQVVLRNQTSAGEFKSVTGPAGEYKLEALPGGDYEFEVLMPGFARYQRRGIRLVGNTNTTVNAILRLGEVQETVQVTAPGQARPQTRPPQRVLVGGYVQPVRLLKQVKAAYPDTARAEGREGNVMLKAVIGVDGAIANVTVLPGADADLAAAAEQAVRQWVYQPTMLNGKPVETVTTVEVNFRLGPA